MGQGVLPTTGGHTRGVAARGDAHAAVAPLQRSSNRRIGNVLQGKWAMKLDVQGERYPFFLLWGAACAAQKQASQFRLVLPKFELPSFW